MLRECGVEVFSPGPWVEPANDGNPSLRPNTIQEMNSPEDTEAWQKMVASLPEGINPKDSITEEFASRFDASLIIHIPYWVQNNWDAFKNLTTIWRTNGQSVPAQELAMSVLKKSGRLKILRYSPTERYIGSYAGEDALIRFYKDEDEFSGWTGKKKQVLTVGNAIERRGDWCGWPIFDSVTKPFSRVLAGPESETLSYGIGEQSFENLKELYRSSRVYFYMGTWPACYTLNFIEAWMTGIPIVALGPKKGNMPGHFSTYEIPDLFSGGMFGFCSDNNDDLRYRINELLTRDDLAAIVSSIGRAKAIAIFGKKVIKPLWQEFISTL